MLNWLLQRNLCTSQFSSKQLCVLNLVCWRKICQNPAVFIQPTTQYFKSLQWSNLLRLTQHTIITCRVEHLTPLFFVKKSTNIILFTWWRTVFHHRTRCRCRDLHSSSRTYLCNSSVVGGTNSEFLKMKPVNLGTWRPTQGWWPWTGLPKRAFHQQGRSGVSKSRSVLPTLQLASRSQSWQSPCFKAHHLLFSRE